MRGIRDKLTIGNILYIVEAKRAINCCLDYSVHKIRIIDSEEANDMTHLNSLKVVFVTEDDNVEHFIFLDANDEYILDDSPFERIFLTENEANYYILERCNKQIDSITIARDLAEKRLAHYLWQLRKIVPKCFKIKKKEEYYDRQD